MLPRAVEDVADHLAVLEVGRLEKYDGNFLAHGVADGNIVSSVSALALRNSQEEGSC
mgnify:CR=1